MDAAAVEGHDDEVAGFSFFFFFLSSMVTDEGSVLELVEVLVEG